MPFSDTAKKLKKLSQTAEKLYARMNELVEQIKDVRDRVEQTGDQIAAMERELAEQRAILDALAEREDIDIDAVLAEATLPSERYDVEVSEGDGDGSGDGGGESDGESDSGGGDQ